MSGPTKPRPYYRGIEHAERPSDFISVKGDEFPTRRGVPDIDRRSLLKFAGGSLAMASLASGCRFLPQQKIVPFVTSIEGYTPGVDKHYATAAGIGGFAQGLLVRSYEGRPIKIEGNPNHPSSLGACDHRLLAETAVLYDPDRLKEVGLTGSYGTWAEFAREARTQIADASKGDGHVVILTGNVGSPTLADKILQFLDIHPGARWYQYEPANRDNVREGAVMAFGAPVDSVYSFANADVVLSLDADPTSYGPGRVRYARDFASRRNPEVRMSRVFAVESSPTPMGACADHRFRAKPSEILAFAQALAHRLGVSGAGPVPVPPSIGDKALETIAADLMGAGGRCLLVVGEHLPASVHAIAHAVNAQLGAVRYTVSYVESVLPAWRNNQRDLTDLVGHLEAGSVKMLLILGGNPVYDVPGDVDVAGLLAKVPLTAHLSVHDNETSAACRWQLPMSHFLEAWGDARAHDGTTSIVQPIIEPLYDSRSEIEVMSTLLNDSMDAIGSVKSTLRLSEDGWAEALASGTVPNSAAPTASPRLIANLAAGLPGAGATGIELVVMPDPNIHDGRYANVSWLQELPKPLTNLTWDNAVHVSPATAKRLGVGQQTKTLGIIPFYGSHDLVEVRANGRAVTMAVYINPGMADDTAVVHLGYGRERAGQFGTKGDPETHGGGFDIAPLRSMTAMWGASNAEIVKASGQYALANTQFHNTLDVDEVDSGRDIIREVTLAEYQENPDVLQHPTEGKHADGGEHHEEGDKSLYQPEKEFLDPATNYQWAMTVDLNLCNGCNACVVACQSENNIPSVGKEQVMNGREMHWIRIDRYYRAKGEEFDANDPMITFQPLTCMQCEKAPCEPVCPVAATVHSHEGLNQMVYNRCVGTRYCSNNCPYKVRRFNFLHWTARPEQVPVLKLLQNPDVTVRGRGVMEKCTYCVHRINHARIDAKKEKREIRDGEVVTACQQACPTGAIIFGDKRREANLVAKSRTSRRNYLLLESTNTAPRTSYLGKVRNPNPGLEA